MRIKFKSRLDHYTVHCPTCGTSVKPGSVVGPRPAGRNDEDKAPRREVPFGIVPADRWESWATDLLIDRELENR